ncbi:MAG TPA: hypothetical protein VIJ95_13185 [Hanamia sp.]
MIISIFEDFQIFDAGSKSSVEKIINKISITSSDVTLNLSRCILDYPATSLIIDKILNDLLRKDSPRVLIIQTHLNIIEILLLHWLFIGSIFFQIDDSKKKIMIDEFKALINKKLSSKKIKLQLQIIDKSGNLLTEFTYGKH